MEPEPRFFAWSRGWPNLVGVGFGTSDFRSRNGPKKVADPQHCPSVPKKRFLKSVENHGAVQIFVTVTILIKLQLLTIYLYFSCCFFKLKFNFNECKSGSTALVFWQVTGDPVLWIRICIGSIFISFVDPDPYSAYGSGSRHVNTGKG